MKPHLQLIKPLFTWGFLVLLPFQGLADTLTWEQTARQARENNAALEAASQTQKASQASARSQFGLFFPQISASLSESENHLRNPIGDTNTRVYSADLNLSQNLFNGFGDLARYRKAQAEAEVAAAALQITEAQVSYDLVSAFASVFHAQESEALGAAIEKRREDNLRMVELRFQSGNENKGSVLLSRAYLQDARYSRSQAQHNLTTAQALMNQVLGRDSATEFQLTGEIPLRDPGTKPDFKNILLETPEHRQSIARENSSTESVSVARSGLWPSLNLSGSTGKQGSEFFPDQNHWTLGVTLSIPLFSGGTDYYATQSAKATAQASTFTRQNNDRDLLKRLQQTYLAYVESVEKLQVDTAYAEAAKARAEIGRSKYNNGLLNFDQWDQIENDLILRQRTLLNSRRDRALNEAAWNQIQGKGVLP